MYYSHNIHNDRVFESYYQEMPSAPLHASHREPRPESLVDLNFNKKSQEENAYISIGVGRNSLGLKLELPKRKTYLIPALERARVKYQVID